MELGVEKWMTIIICKILRATWNVLTRNYELYGVIVNNHEKRRILRWVYGVCLLVGICAHLRAFSRQDIQGCYDARGGH